MTDSKFKSEVFDKLNEAYKLLKMIKDCGPHDNEDTWAEWVEACEKYTKSIKDERLQSAFGRFLLDMGDCISNINKGEL